MRLLKVMLRVLVALVLALALLGTWAWWYYRPTLEYSFRGRSSPKSEEPK
jgi:hypothetical protein